jgi:hypothetical protein
MIGRAGGNDGVRETDDGISVDVVVARHELGVAPLRAGRRREGDGWKASSWEGACTGLPSQPVHSMLRGGYSTLK